MPTSARDPGVRAELLHPGERRHAVGGGQHRLEHDARLQAKVTWQHEDLEGAHRQRSWEHAKECQHQHLPHSR